MTRGCCWWLSGCCPYRCLGGIGVGQWRGQPLKVPAAGTHPSERVGALDQRVAAPGGAQDAARFWNVGVPCRQTNGQEGQSQTALIRYCGQWKTSDEPLESQ